jgi:hypothetical protein
MVSCWSSELAERDWHNLRGKRLYNHPDTVRGFFRPVLREVFFKNISRIFLCVDKILISFYLFQENHEENGGYKNKRR